MDAVGTIKLLSIEKPFTLCMTCVTVVPQAESLLKFVEAIPEKILRSTVTLTAACGRGKSAALIQSTNQEFNEAVFRVNIYREHRQTTRYSTTKGGGLTIFNHTARLPLIRCRFLTSTHCSTVCMLYSYSAGRPQQVVLGQLATPANLLGITMLPLNLPEDSSWGVTDSLLGTDPMLEYA